MEEKPQTRIERHANIQSIIENNPFISDDELANLLKVSIHTIRADRRKIGIPEVRKRGGGFSDSLFAQAKALSNQEIVGDLLEIDLDKEGLSLLDTNEQMGLQKSKIIRGHILFAQANTLANAIVDAEIALTGEANIKFMAPVFAGERVLAKAHIISVKHRRKEVYVIMKTKKKLVFEGTFIIYCLNQELASHLNMFTDEEVTGETK